MTAIRQAKRAKQRVKRSRLNRDLLLDSEGLIDFCQAAAPYEDTDDRRQIGWNLGRQIIAQHVVELALKVELAKHRPKVPKNHDLGQLFRALPQRRRNKAEKVYHAILKNSVAETWDVFRTIDSFVRFLGANPSVETRYYWDDNSVSNTLGVDSFANLISPQAYVHLVYALMIAFHEYPTKPPKDKFDTRFISLKDSLTKDVADTLSFDEASKSA